MSPDYNPFNSPEFRKEMAELLDDKLQPFGELDQRVSALERWRWYIVGIFTAVVGGLKLWFSGK